MGTRVRPLYNIPKYTEAEKQIIAWSLEWEGYISIYNEFTNKLIPAIGISNTNIYRLTKFREIIKLGKISKLKNNRKNPRTKTWAAWQTASCLECWYILKNVFPYLIGKKEQAQIVIDFVESRLRRGFLIKTGVPVSKFEYSLAYKIRKLNRRGVQNDLALRRMYKHI